MFWLILIGFIVVALVVALLAALVVAAQLGGAKRPKTPPAGTKSVRSVGSSEDTAGKIWSSAPSVAGPGAQRGSRQFPITWFGPDQSLDVGGFSLRGPCVYASSGHRWATDPSEVLLEADVRRPRAPIPDTNHYPWYSRLDPETRFQYLQWLATGRTSLPEAEGSLWLYFYGIERRLLVDDADRGWGLREVVRLRRLDAPRLGTPQGSLFRRSSTALLWFEIARTPSGFDDRSFSKAIELTECWTAELIAAPLSWLGSRGKPLPADLARATASFSPLAQRSVVTTRVGDEFATLFAKRYLEEYGENGMQLRISKRLRRHSYRPASSGLGPVTCLMADPTGIPSQFKPLAALWNSCIADLKKLSRVSASLGTGELTVQAWEAMPEDLRADVDHPLTEQVSAVVAHSRRADTAHDAASTAGLTLIPAGRFATMLGVQERSKLTAAQSRKVAEMLGQTGYAVVPDARISSVTYGWDDLVAVLPGLDDQVELSRYNAASCMLRLGLSIALVDGDADEKELEALTTHIDATFDLSPAEEQRLHALRALLLRTGSDIRPIARRLESLLPLEARRSVGRLLVVIAATSNGIDRRERAALRKAYRALGLAPELLEETIAEIAPARDDSLVTVRKGEPSADRGEAIPKSATAPPLRLDREAICAIMAETRAVASLLAAAMAEVESADESFMTEAGATQHAQAVAPAGGRSTDHAKVRSAASGAVSALGRYTGFYEAVVARQRWNRVEAEALARQHGVMLSGAIETINDWALEELGGPLIDEDGDALTIDRLIA